MEPLSAVERLRRYFGDRIWDERPAELPRGRAALLRATRVAYSTVRGFLEDQLTVRAAALTYFSVLSLVPLLAFTFAILKGFGAYRTLVDETVRPYLRVTFGANPALHQALERVLEFVEQTDVSRLGAVGLVFLVYAAVTLVSSVEDALNGIFRAKTTRSPLRQLTDYVTLLVTTPILVFAAATLSTAAQSSDLVLFLRERLRLGPLIDFGLGLTPILVVCLGLFAMYVILPNVRTRVGSAFIGAMVAALGWQISLVLHVQLQMGVARYNALYSVLGALPIFLVWTYVSWLIVLIGAEIAASHQNERQERQRLRGRRADQALKELLAVGVAARVARDFLEGGPRRTATQLAALHEVPVPEVEDILDALVRAGLLVRTVSGRDIGHVPGRDLDAIRASDLGDALRREPRADDVRAGVERQLGPGLQELLRSLESERRSSPHNATLRELAALARPDAPPAHGGRTNGTGEPPEPDVVDGKQPELPG